MKFFRPILSLVAAFHLVFATSGVPLVYMFCGDNFCSMTLATGSLQTQTNTLQEWSGTEAEETSCENETPCCSGETSDEEKSGEESFAEGEPQCRTELHIAQLSVDALQAVSSLALDSSAPVIAILPIHSFAPQSLETQDFPASVLANPPPAQDDKHILFRSLLI